MLAIARIAAEHVLFNRIRHTWFLRPSQGWLLDQFSRFCTVRGGDQYADTQTEHTARYVIDTLWPQLASMHRMHAMQLLNQVDNRSSVPKIIGVWYSPRNSNVDGGKVECKALFTENKADRTTR